MWIVLRRRSLKRVRYRLDEQGVKANMIRDNDINRFRVNGTNRVRVRVDV